MEWYQWLLLIAVAPFILALVLFLWQLPAMIVLSFVKDAYLHPFEEPILFWGPFIWVYLGYDFIKEKVKEKPMSNGLLGGIFGNSLIGAQNAATAGNISMGSQVGQMNTTNGVSYGISNQSIYTGTQTVAYNPVPVVKQDLTLVFSNGFYDIQGICIRNLDDIQVLDFNGFRILVNGDWLQLNVPNWQFHRDEYKQDILNFITKMQHAKKIGAKFDDLIEG